MKPRADDLHLWAVVAATVRPLAGRVLPAPSGRGARIARPGPIPAPPSLRRHPVGAPKIIEPGRLRRMALGRETLGARLDLHGLDQASAHAALADFISTAAARGLRAVLVITGKGALGDGLLRRQVPEWLAQAPLRALIAGLSEAHRRHGGAGALYVALRRQTRG